MDEEKKVTEEKLLYDPMFDHKPVLDWTDSPKGGFFGKSAVKKTLFIIVLLASIAGALFFSFNSISKDIYEYKQRDDGTYQLTAFNGQKNNTVLCLDYVRDESSKADKSKTVSAVKKYTVSGNDTLQFIFVGKDVEEIERTAFFYCTSLNAIYVDKDNSNYTSIDGILYKTENGKPTEAVLCPQQYTRYQIALSQGVKEPTTPEEAAELAKKFTDEEYCEKLDEAAADEKVTEGKTIIIPDSVKTVEQLCFAYCNAVTEIRLPSELKEIETMAFFKCTALKSAELPDSIEIIGSDAFSKCESLTYLFIPKSIKSIGHNAFWECKNIEKVYVEAENLDNVEAGRNWVPQYRKTFMKDREIVFGAERQVG